MNRTKQPGLIFFFIPVLMLCLPAPCLVSEKVVLLPHETTEIEKEFFKDLDDGELSEYSLFDGFLIASLLNKSSNFEKYRPGLNDIVDQVKKEFDYDDDPYAKADSLLKWLHINTFKSYYLNSFAYNIVAFGEFNCLSSGILYALLAREIGLNVVGVLAKDHAYCRLLDPRGDKDIQTTAKYGFEPVGKNVSRINRLTGFNYDPDQRDDSLQFVEMLPFIGALYANRISLIEVSTGTFRDDLSIYKKGYYFNPNTSFFKQNILASYNNICIEAVKQKMYHEVPAFLQAVQPLAGPDSTVWDNTWKTFLSEGNRMYASNYYDESREILEKGLEVFPNHPELKNLKTVVLLSSFFNRAQAEFAQRNFEEALATTESGLKELPEAGELIELKSRIDSARGTRYP